jgi:hypothetical protein
VGDMVESVVHNNRKYKKMASGTSSSIFKGDINENITLSDILQTLESQHKVGAIKIDTKDNNYVIQVKYGDIGINVPGEAKLHLPTKLLFAKRIPADDCNKAQELTLESSLQWLKQKHPEVTYDALETICFDELCNVISLEEGTFEFVAEKKQKQQKKKHRVADVRNQQRFDGSCTKKRRTTEHLQ